MILMLRLQLWRQRGEKPIGNLFQDEGISKFYVLLK